MIGSAEVRKSFSGDGASTITADAIAALVAGELIGDAGASISGVAPLDRAGAGDLSILSSAKYASMMASTRAGIVLVDPELTLLLPPSLTASTALDALTQLIEAYISPRANPVTDLFALDGIGRSARSFLRAFHDGGDPDAREDLALASLFGGFALANAGLGAVHGIAAPLGGRHPIPHGVACFKMTIVGPSMSMPASW